MLSGIEGCSLTEGRVKGCAKAEVALERTAGSPVVSSRRRSLHQRALHCCIDVLGATGLTIKYISA
jgi:hypothetical protein